MKSLCQKWPNSAIGARCASIFQFRYETEGELIWRYLNLKMNIANPQSVGVSGAPGLCAAPKTQHLTVALARLDGQQAQMGAKFHAVFEAVELAMAQTTR